jgi:hypothetical protein
VAVDLILTALDIILPLPVPPGVTRGHRFLRLTVEPWAVEAWAKVHAKARDPERRRKIAEAHRGNPGPPHVIEAIRQAWRGSHHTEESRRKMSESHRKDGTMVRGRSFGRRKKTSC